MINLDIGLNVFRKIEDIWRAGRSDSLVDYTKPARVSPLTLIDSDVVFHEMTPDVMQSLLSMFSGYYLQAACLSLTVGKIEVMRHLDRLNPNRSPLDSAANSAGWLLATEGHKDPTSAYAVTSASSWTLHQRNYEYGLPTPQMKIGMEALGELIVGNREEDGTYADSAAGNSRNVAAELKELSNLAYGKMLAVEVSDGGHHMTLNVSVQLGTSSMPSDRLVHILTANTDDTSAKERYHGWASGRLDFIRDVIMAEDQISKYRKNLMQDSDGIYSSMVERANKNRLAAVFSANPSIAQASSLYVISDTTAERIERESNLRFKSFKDREKIFKNTYLMILVVIQKEWNRAKFYHRGIEQPTEVSMRDLQSANKGSGPSVSDILKAYSLGNTPSL